MELRPRASVGIAVEARWEMGIYLETERLILRRFTAADADLLVELDSDPEVMRYLTGGLPLRATHRRPA